MLFKPRTKHSDITQFANITPFAKCPSCHQLIKMKSFTDAVLEGSRNCPFCQSFIDKKEIITSCQIYLKTTLAIQSAGEILALNRVLPILFGINFLGMVFIYFDEDKFSFLMSIFLFGSILCLIGGFLKTQKWLADYSLIKTTEEEFIVVKEKISRSQIIWLVANNINLVIWFIFIKFL